MPASIILISKVRLVSHLAVYTLNIEEKISAWDTTRNTIRNAISSSRLSLDRKCFIFVFFHSSNQEFFSYYHLKNDLAICPLREIHKPVAAEMQGEPLSYSCLFVKKYEWFSQRETLIKWTNIFYYINTLYKVYY